MKEKDIEGLTKELYTMYKVWLVSFPFELSSLIHLKEEYFNYKPLINDSSQFDLDEDFEGVAPLHTRESFYEYLSELTINIIEANNYRSMYKKGELPEKNYCLIELAECKRRIKDDVRRYQAYELDLPYLKHIESWLEDEKHFIEEELSLYEGTNQTKQEKKIPAKWYAFLHTILIELGIEVPFRLDENGNLKKAEIIEFAQVKYGLPNGQGFYNNFRDYRNASPEQIAAALGNNYKSKIIQLSNNNHKVIQLLKKYPS